MISLYIHIPFCDYKCDYCNFYVIQKNHPNFLPTLVSDYITSIKKELDRWKTICPQEQIRTIYLGGGTPSSIGRDMIVEILDHVKNNRDVSDLEEFSMELNPDPFDENIQLIRSISNRYKDRPRIRFSFGIQSFDDEVLKLAGRKYVFNNIKGFLRNLQPIKKPNMVYNFDMIAFGTLENWNDSRVQFWEDFVGSQMADSFSIYTLELFPGSKWHQLSQTTGKTQDNHLLQTMIHPDDDKVMEEFDYLKNTLIHHGYNRYETSNFARPGFASAHNQVYWNLDQYIGIGASASGFVCLNHIGYEDKLTDYLHILDLDKNHKAIRYANTTSISDYIKGNYIDKNKINLLTDRDLLIEGFFLKMRSGGVDSINKYKDVLVSDFDNKIKDMILDGLLEQEGSRLRFTDKGYDISNTILSDLIFFQK